MTQWVKAAGQTGNHYSWRRIIDCIRVRRRESTLWILLPSSHFLHDAASGLQFALSFPMRDVMVVLGGKGGNIPRPLVCVVLFPLPSSVEPEQRAVRGR